MRLISIGCPSCHGELHIPEEKQEVFCMHCGYKFVVKDISKATAHAETGDEWEYQNLSFNASEGDLALRNYGVYSGSPQEWNDEAAARLKLWISNKKSIEEWLSQRMPQGWELADVVDFSCLRIKSRRRSLFEGLVLSSFLEVPWVTWYIEGWDIPIKRRTQ